MALPRFILLAFACYHVCVPTAEDRCTDCLDMFPGVKHISQSFQGLGSKTLSFEKKDGVAGDQDLCTLTGWTNASFYANSLRVGGVSMWGIVCSTWIWVRRHSTKRGLQNVCGDESSPDVRGANMMVARAWLLISIPMARQCIVCV